MSLICLGYNFDIRESILIVLDKIASQKVSNQKILSFPTSPSFTGAFALPGETQKHKIASFHSNAVTALSDFISTSRWLNLFSLVILATHTYAPVCLPKSRSQWNNELNSRLLRGHRPISEEVKSFILQHLDLLNAPVKTRLSSATLLIASNILFT